MTAAREIGIAGGGYRAVVQTTGATVRALEFRGEPVLDGFEAHDMPEAGHGQVLAPWPNRLYEGRWRWNGTELHLPVDEPQRGRSASHGLARWLLWHVAESSTDHVTLTVELGPRPGYPFWLRLQCTYRVCDTGLRVNLTAENTGPGPAPVALGAHPYLLPTAGLDGARLQVPATEVVEFDDHGATDGPRPVSGTALDLRSATTLSGLALNNTLGGLHRLDDGTVRCVLHDADRDIELWAGATCRWLQVYTGDALSPGRRRRSVAVEPMTAPPQALATGTDLAVLAPGATLGLEWGIRVRAAGPGPKSHTPDAPGGR